MIHSKRILSIGILLLIAFGFLIYHLSMLQLFRTTSYSSGHVNLIQKSIEQRTTSYVVNDGRGALLDRNGVSLTTEKKRALILFPFLKNEDWPIDQVSHILGISSTDLTDALAAHNQPFAYKPMSISISSKQAQSINALHILGAEVLEVTLPKPGSLNSYILGVASQNPTLVKKRYSDLLNQGIISTATPVGTMGLQEAFDPFLLSRNETKLLYHTTGDGDPLFKNSVRYSSGASDSYYPLKVKTTLDASIQKMAEQLVTQSGIKKGGLVLLDAKSNNLLAMVSRPALNSSDPFKYPNYMLTPEFPGSVFKVVTAAAAIESNIVNDQMSFDCNQNVYGDGASNRQLGTLNFDDSFAESCNYTFATLGNRLLESNLNALDDTADKLGLLSKAGWTGDVFHYQNFEQIPGEGTTTIFKKASDRHQTKAIAQTAIGQLNVKVTPLAIANMMSTIARGGEKWEVRTATEIDYNNMGNMQLVTFPHKTIQGPSLKPYTIMQLQDLLREVVTSPKGTGRALQDAAYSVAGKSGTAETGKGTENSWFAGYFPADDPQYVLVAVDLDVSPGTGKALTLFKNMVNGLAKMPE
ncbi:penicillin-binding transpeptidase domain-containing protein [Pullulanibacillus sp. KACC 23026]|uniref:peptidoglycan D,D-transpeptidase FtsI family protein n=1 Tax=Pullulanibacillus sp. KACC 23026 TaxID=3028315 RepID=UPI0023AF9987|nr:penicillin-binding transpeptidase domain-containing protein [Pullulanibacillus sp. KACC 23026]WEG14102.1 penicillin-binding transpeptidase domain-containing protein [Pullulanibacillus sp. KACC 23026]